MQLDRAHEAKDQVGCKDCSKLRDACSREMAKARPRTRKPTQNNKPSAHKRGHLLAKCMENLCKTVEISSTWFTVLVQGKPMQVAKTSHGPHYATSPQELALPLSGTAALAKLHYKHGPPQNLSTHGSLSQVT